MKRPRDDDKYQWTTHAWEKMQHYQLPESRVKRVVRFPKRLEESVVPGTVSVMQPSSPSWKQEIWVMYKLVKSEGFAPKITNFKLPSKRVKIITVWRYPGKSPERDPIPEDVLSEIQQLL
ncbi:MAG: hypothetical protein Q7R98_00020 [Candidatus Jorgensenbacteria bacterium]|nr:hypothetical protein [Candidatus Jorgensenbacteria bacterium]